MSEFKVIGKRLSCSLYEQKIKISAYKFRTQLSRGLPITPNVSSLESLFILIAVAIM